MGNLEAIWIKRAHRGPMDPVRASRVACPGLEAAMYPDWRGGAFGEILDDGVITVGDLVRWEGEP